MTAFEKSGKEVKFDGKNIIVNGVKAKAEPRIVFGKERDSLTVHSEIMTIVKDLTAVYTVDNDEIREIFRIDNNEPVNITHESAADYVEDSLIKKLYNDTKDIPGDTTVYALISYYYDLSDIANFKRAAESTNTKTAAAYYRTLLGETQPIAKKVFNDKSEFVDYILSYAKDLDDDLGVIYEIDW